MESIDSLLQLLQRDKNIDWELFISRHQEYSPAFAYLITASLNPKKWFSKTVGLDFEFKYYKRVGDEYYWSKSRCQYLKEILNNRGNANSRFYLKLIKKSESYCQELIDWSLGVSEKDFSGKTNQELAILFQKYWEKLKNAAAFMLIKHNLNQVLEKRIKDKLSKISEEDVFNELLVPAKDTLIIQADKKLKELSLKDKISSKEIDNWLKMYGWIQSFTWFEKSLTRSYINKRMFLLRKENVAKYKKTELLKEKFKNDIYLLSEIEALQYLIYFHTFEIECLFASHFWCGNLLKEISVRIGLSFKDYPYAIYPEILDALNGKPLDKKKILKRKNNRYTIYLFEDNISIFEGEAFLKAKENISVRKAEKTEIKGRPAFHGKVKGKAIIIKTIKDFKKFKKGNIIVSPMTTTNFTHYLKNAKAIITDEGGVTCHAAIVAREFGIPCIVGCKNATKVLKDGDLVEVDAVEGKVKKIN